MECDSGWYEFYKKWIFVIFYRVLCINKGMFIKFWVFEVNIFSINVLLIRFYGWKDDKGFKD